MVSELLYDKYFKSNYITYKFYILWYTILRVYLLVDMKIVLEMNPAFGDTHKIVH